MHSGLFIPSKPFFPHAHPFPVSYHQMVKEFHIKQLPCFYKLPRHQHILNIYMENHLTV